MTTKLREQSAVQIGVDKTGKPVYRSFVSGQSDARRTWIQIPPDTVIPIVFVPGIMGSNLKAKADIRDRNHKIIASRADKVWRVDGKQSMAGWPLKGAAARQLLLNKDVLEVDPRGDIPGEPNRPAGMRHTAAQDGLATPLSRLSVATARSRGWGEVSAMFYGNVLDWLEQQLNGAEISPKGEHTPILAQHLAHRAGQLPHGTQGRPPVLTAEQVKHMTSFDFPVHAYGYNWLASNLDSGRLLVKRITTIRDFYRNQGRKCDKVILVTHSMGGLVARAACKVHGGEDLVWGVVHGVMPTDGAAATYKRFAAGFGGEGSAVTGMVLGSTGQKTTPALAFSPGPLELLPNKRYNQGKPWFWIKDAQGRTVLSLPQRGDPYQEIYARQDVWWRMVNPAWLNPAGMPNSDINTFAIALSRAKLSHAKLAGKFHARTYAHYALDASLKAWSSVGWEYRGDPADSSRWKSQGDGTVIGPAYPGAHVHTMLARISAPGAAGDGTVPGLASAAGVDAGAQVVCRQTGYAHDGSCNDAGARQSMLDAILRIIAPIPEPQ